MSGHENEGDHAFPSQQSANLNPGMSLRDYFAAKAMQAVTAAGYSRPEDALTLAKRIAADAYAIADAMLAFRERG